ncbi:MAG: ABC transporter permease subunit [Bauldia sp.]
MADPQLRIADADIRVGSAVAGLAVDPGSRASFWYQMVDTLHATVLGFVIGSVGGIVLAAVMAESRVVQRILFPYIVGFQCLPKVAIAPLYVIWFGYEIQSKIAMSATLVMFPVVLNAMEGFMTAERERLDLMTSLDARPLADVLDDQVSGCSRFHLHGAQLGIVNAFLAPSSLNSWAPSAAWVS